MVKAFPYHDATTNCLFVDPIMMVAEAVPFGSLLDYLRELKDTHIRMNIAGHSNYTLTMDILGFGAQVARGMAYLSSQRVRNFLDFGANQIKILMGISSSILVECWTSALWFHK